MPAYNESEYVELELKLAALLGWSNFHVAENSTFGVRTFGTPPKDLTHGYQYDIRCTMPQWCRDWHAAASLILPYKISILTNWNEKASDIEIRAWQPDGGFVTYYIEFGAHQSLEHAVRVGIVKAVIEILEKKNATN